MNESFFELTQNNNPVLAIEEALNAIRAQIRMSMRTRVQSYLVKKMTKVAILKWECNEDKVIEINNWVTKVRAQMTDFYTVEKDEFVDEMINILTIFNIKDELKTACMLELEIAKINRVGAKNDNH